MVSRKVTELITYYEFLVYRSVSSSGMENANLACMFLVKFYLSNSADQSDTRQQGAKK